MNLQSSRYDPDLQMFAELPREPDLACLRFWRWLGEQGLLEHRPAGPPSGVYALEVPIGRVATRCRQVAGSPAPPPQWWSPTSGWVRPRSWDACD
jgi:hypothetical protein